MKKIILLAAFLLVLSSTANVQAAPDYELNIVPIKKVVKPSESANFLINITNTYDENQTFEIYTQSLYPGWEYLKDYKLTIEPGETKSTNLYVTPPKTEPAGRRGFVIYVTPVGQKNDSREENSYIEIKRDKKLIFLTLSTDKTNYSPGSEVQVFSSLKNVHNKDISDYSVLFSIGNRTEEVNVPSLNSGTTTEIKTSLDIGKYDYGEYTIKAKVEHKENVSKDEMTTKINVPGNVDIERTRNVVDNILWKDITLKIENTGNLKSEIQRLETNVPLYLEPLLSAERNPTIIEENKGVKTYKWEVGPLAPGERDSITYRLNYWIIIAIIGLIAIVSIFAYVEMRSATIMKKTRRAGNEHSVHIILENNTGKKIDHVEVEDFVPGISKLIEKFDSAKPSSIKKKEDGTELLWELGSLEAGEERILMYKIKPVVEVEGFIRLPRAKLTYKTKRGKRKAISHKANANFQ